MPKHLTFGDIPVNDLFVTGPAGTLFIKLDDDPILNNVPGGTAMAIEDGTKVWTPANRIVLEPKNKHFVEAGQKYTWEHMCAAAQAEQSRLMEEASRY
jgi:hypothetical protein